MIAILETIRIENKISQLQLAERIGVNRSYLSKLEKKPELCNPTVKVIFKLAIALNVEPCMILRYFWENRKIEDEEIKEDQDA